MDKVRYFVYGLFLALAISSYPVQAKFSCAKTEDIIVDSFSKKYIFLATRIIGKTTAIVVMFDRDGNFKIIGTDENSHACILMQGTDWQFAAQELMV